MQNKNPSEGGIDMSIHCVVPEKIHTHPMEGHRKLIGGGRGVLKAKLKKKCMKTNWNLLGEREVQNIKPSVGGVWNYFMELHILYFLELHNAV